jgi:hypothetical protein
MQKKMTNTDVPAIRSGHGNHPAVTKELSETSGRHCADFSSSSNMINIVQVFFPCPSQTSSFFIAQN